MKSYFKNVKTAWQSAWQERSFRISFLLGMSVIVMVVPLLPAFYGYIEARQGIVLNDWLLQNLQPKNVSLPVFIIVWFGACLVSIRASTTPRIFLNYLYAYIVFILVRSICLLLVPLDPPIGIIELKDPLTDLFYGGSFIRKDLFFSGHTATLVIMYLSLEKKEDKYFCRLGGFAVAALLLVQHVHYTIDVVAAPFFALLCFNLGQKWIKKMSVLLYQKASPS